MLRYTETTVFNVDVQTIVNTINCVGVMGAGLALEFKLRFPEMEQDYVERCKLKQVKIGKPYLYREYGYPWILNFPTKHHWKNPTQLDWIKQGLEYFRNNYKKGGITSIAFPKLGCSNGGLEWSVVSPVMEEFLQDLEIDIFICEDTEKEASRTEGLMVEMINNIENHSWSSEFNLSSNAKNKIIASLPIGRFRELRKVEGIGKQTYNKIFQFLYSLVINKEQKNNINNQTSKNLDLLTDNSQASDHFNINLEQKTENEEQLEPHNQLDSQENFTHHSSEGEPNLSSSYDAFEILLPYFEEALKLEHTRDEVAEKFNLPKKLVGDWLKEAEQLGKIKKCSRRPVKYIATQSMKSEQLECNLGI